MWTVIQQIVQGLVSGVVGPVFGYLSKKQDVTVDGFKAATGADVSQYSAWLQYQTQIQAQKSAANAWIGPRVLYIVVGGAYSVHAAAVALDSTFGFGWSIAKLPTQYFPFEEMVVGSLFVASLTAGPVSAISQWLHRR